MGRQHESRLQKWVHKAKLRLAQRLMPSEWRKARPALTLHPRLTTAAEQSQVPPLLGQEPGKHVLPGGYSLQHCSFMMQSAVPQGL